MAPPLYAYAPIGLAVGAAALLIAGDTPPERRARVWSLALLAAALWPAALAYVALVVADELRKQGRRGALTPAQQEGA